MIKTAIQLKAKIRNISGSDSKVAMTMIRVFFEVMDSVQNLVVSFL